MDGHGLLDFDLCFFNGIIRTIFVQKPINLELLLGGWSPNFLSPADGCIFNGRCNTKSWARCMLFDRIYHATCSKVVLIICNHCTSGRFVGPAKHQLLNGLHGLSKANLPFMNAIGRFMRVNNQSTTWKVQPTLASTLTHGSTWHDFVKNFLVSHASPCRSFGCFQLGFLRSLFDQFHLAGQLVAFQPGYEISLENDGLIRSKQCSMLFNVLFLRTGWYVSRKDHDIW